MLCENCKKNPATIHLTEITNNVKKEIHLCPKCAEEKGVTMQTAFSFSDLLAGLASAHAPVSGKQLEIACPRCGIKYHEFQSGGRFGCANDYEAFAEVLVPLIEKIQGSTQHVGKTPKNVDRVVAQEKQLNQLQKELKKAIEREDYELAAGIRDKMREMQGKKDAPE